VNKLSSINIEQYITCREECTLQYLESLAMIGLAVKAEVEDCDKENFKRIKLRLVNDQVVTSMCRYVEEVMQSLRIINVYIGYKRRLNN